MGIEGKESSIQDLYVEIINSEIRNQQIIDDILANYKCCRNCIVLSLRTAHVEKLAQKLRETAPDSDVVELTGGMGYKAKSEDISSVSLDIIYNRDSFLPVFNNDIVAAGKEILIVSPFVRKRRAMQMIQQLKIAAINNVRVIVVTRPVEEFKKANGFTFPMAADPDRSIFKLFASGGIPRTYIIGRDGTILYQSPGYKEAEFGKKA